MLTDNYLEKRLVELERRKEQALGQLNIIIGAIAEVRAMRDEMGKELTEPGEDEENRTPDT